MLGSAAMPTCGNSAETAKPLSNSGGVPSSKSLATPQSGPPSTADRLRHRHRLSARADGSAHVGVVPLQSFAKAERTACSDLEVDPVRPQREPGGDQAIGGVHIAVDEAGSDTTVAEERQSSLRRYHDL